MNLIRKAKIVTNETTITFIRHLLIFFTNMRVQDLSFQNFILHRGFRDPPAYFLLSLFSFIIILWK